MKIRKMTKKTCVVIPALNPPAPERFYDYLKDLTNIDNLSLLVVNDGSSSEYHELFSKINRLPRCTVLPHHKNKGKGAALKTAFTFLQSQEETDTQIVCADCDGQHSIADVLRLAEAGGTRPGTLILGERQFSRENIPWKSRLGNRVSSLLFYLAGGTWIQDTQTGLRAFHSSLLPVLLSVPGRRFEYETRVLTHCMEHHYPLYQMEIETIYENGNKSTHFRPILDSFYVLSALLKPMAKFLASSLGCAGLDLLLFLLFCNILWKTGTIAPATVSVLATVLARIFSTGLNYFINKNYVFASPRLSRIKNHVKLERYLLLCVSITLVSGILVSYLSSLFSAAPGGVKILVDSMLFLLSYLLQKKWVFSEGGAYDEV